MSLIYDLISNAYQVREINANSHRNFLEIIDLIRELKQIIVARKKGVWEITTARKTSLADALLHIHNEQVPDQIKLVEGEQNVLAESSDLCIPAQIIKVDSDFKSVIDNIITDVNGFRVLEKLHSVRRQVLISDKGKMTEISSLESGRLYKISIAPGKVRGNHYHYVQTEDFYVNRGTVVFFLAHRDNPKIAKQLILQENDFIQIPPYYIHTLVSPHKEMEAEVIITSTQPYIPNATPDTKTVTII
jgi:oxalate decarboxylase/phosphoglucose isomerase-like protein (cupin superfamily)